MNNELISQLAKEAVEETQQMMIMYYPTFEAELYRKFAYKLIKEIEGLVDVSIPVSEQFIAGRQSLFNNIKKHFDITEEQ